MFITDKRSVTVDHCEHDLYVHICDSKSLTSWQTVQICAYKSLKTWQTVQICAYKSLKTWQTVQIFDYKSQTVHVYHW